MLQSLYTYILDEHSVMFRLMYVAFPLMSTEVWPSVGAKWSVTT